jgi:hypothetical protein
MLGDKNRPSLLLANGLQIILFEPSSNPLCKRKGAMEPFAFVAVLKNEWTIAIDRAQELSAGSIANSRCFSADIFQGKNRSMSVGTLPPFCAQTSRYHASQVRILIFAMLNVANREKSIAASRPLHNDPEP